MAKVHVFDFLDTANKLNKANKKYRTLKKRNKRQYERITNLQTNQSRIQADNERARAEAERQRVLAEQRIIARDDLAAQVVKLQEKVAELSGLLNDERDACSKAFGEHHEALAERDQAIRERDASIADFERVENLRSQLTRERDEAMDTATKIADEYKDYRETSQAFRDDLIAQRDKAEQHVCKPTTVDKETIDAYESELASSYNRIDELSSRVKGMETKLEEQETRVAEYSKCFTEDHIGTIKRLLMQIRGLQDEVVSYQQQRGVVATEERAQLEQTQSMLQQIANLLESYGYIGQGAHDRIENGNTHDGS